MGLAPEPSFTRYYVHFAVECSISLYALKQAKEPERPEPIEQLRTIKPIVESFSRDMLLRHRHRKFNDRAHVYSMVEMIQTTSCSVDRYMLLYIIEDYYHQTKKTYGKT